MLDFESVSQQEQNGQSLSSCSDNVPLLAGIKWPAKHEVQAGRPNATAPKSPACPHLSAKVPPLNMMNLAEHHSG
jgi:hypothetical protein